MQFLKRVCIGLGIFVVSLPAATAAQRTETLTVVEGSRVLQLFMAPAGQTEWGRNLLPDDHGSHIGIPMPSGRGCVFNIRAVRADETTEEVWNYDVCGVNSKVIYVGCAGHSYCTLHSPSGPAPGAFREVYVMNALDNFPREFYIVPSEATSWRSPLPLNRDWTPTVFTLLGGHCVYHIKIVHKSGRVSFYPNHNACTSQVFSIKGSGVSSDPLVRR